MSNNKKQPQYIGKPAVPVDAGSSVPPRYQPPPQPLQQQPGILKHGPGALSQPSQPPKDVKQHPFAAQHAKQVPADVLKQPPPHQQQQPQLPYPTEGTKFYPHGPVPNLKPGYQGQIFPPQHVAAIGINPNQPGIPRPHRAPPAEEDLRSNPALHQRQPQRVFEEAHGPVPHLSATRPHQEEFFRGVNHQRSQEELAQIPGQLNSHRPTHEEFVGVRGPIQQHRPPPQRFSDEELLRLGPVDMLKFVRKSEGESARIASEQHRHMQALIQELRALKEANQRLGDDNQELRDLCCFLDDDRQKGRKLAREWQRFGRYTASVMRQEVSAYQNKLRELDNKQQELIKDNLELKELCLYLDEERGGSSVCPSCGSAASGGLRDDGDGSSSSTNADEPAVPTQFNSAPVGNAPRRSASRERLLHESLARQRSTFNDQTMQYVRNLEQRVKQLEDEKRILQHKMSQLAAASGGDISDPTLVMAPGNGVVDATVATSGAPVLSGRPEAVVRALQVLEVREQLERNGRVTADRDRANTMIANNVTVDRVVTVNGDNNVDITNNSDMDDGEKALVREMCNVVWRKLEETPPPRR